MPTNPVWPYLLTMWPSALISVSLPLSTWLLLSPSVHLAPPLPLCPLGSSSPPPSHQRRLTARALLHAVPLLSKRLCESTESPGSVEGGREEEEGGREGGREGGSQRLAGHQREAGRVIARMRANIAAQQSNHIAHILPRLPYHTQL